jgi:NAD(P)-dependent dehydrogenase (short-subunit alcohol dehydrogenase family)
MTMSEFSLHGRTVLLTGATGHLGSAVARAAVRAGADLILAGRNGDRLAALAGDLGISRTSRTIVFDVANETQCCAAIEVIAKYGTGLAGIVNCAYSGTVGTIESTCAADFDRAGRETLAGPFTLVQAALPLLREATKSLVGGASIVNVSSMYAHVSPDPRIYGASGRNNPPPYGAAKAGLLQLTRYLAAHLGPDGIRCNSVSPGPFPPPALPTTDPSFHAELCAKTPLGRIGKAVEVGGPVVFLLSGASSYVTGADLAVDGGWTAW